MERSEKAVSRPQRRSSRPLAQRSHNIASPSKSFVMDTGAAGDASPWRIKVTVEAEPQNSSSPTKQVTRTTTVPLKGSSSPVKKSPAKKKKAVLPYESEIEIKRPQRKRKGTPIRRNVKRSSPDQREGEEDGWRTGAIEMSAKLQEELTSPTKAPITRSKKKGTPQPSPAERGRRLAKVQAELRSPTDSDAPEDEAGMLHSEGMAGDMTVANEDFTMISVATLESMKQGNSSLLLDQSGVGDRSVQSVSYMPSSPPRPLRAEDDAFEIGQEEVVGPFEDAAQGDATAAVYDDMSWKPTGPLKSSSILAKAQKSQQPYSEPVEYQLEREAVSRQVENASADEVVVIDSSHSSISSSEPDGMDKEEAVLGAPDPESQVGDDDIWAEEASRSLEEDQTGAPELPQQSSTTAALNDVFSDQASKPPRGKIPRTWRRTSGMDFSYVDSPAHELVQRPPAETRKVSATSTASSKEGDGVLTPPDSSFEEDESKVDAGTAEEDVDVDLTHPDAAATQLQVEERQPIERRRIVPARRTRDATKSSLETSTSSNSLSSHGSVQAAEAEEDAREDDDNGMFWQTNLPSVFQQNRQRKWGSKLLEERRNRKKIADLSEILQSSSEISVDQKSARQKIAVGRSLVHIDEETARSQPRTEQNQRVKAVDSPLRKSLFKSSKIGDKIVPSTAGPEASATGMTGNMRHVRMGAPSSGSEASSESKVETSFADSFESKASDQRQLLTEMHTPATTSRTQPVSVHEDETDLWGAVSEEQDEQHPMSDASYAGSSPGSRLQAAAEPEDVQSDEEEEEIQDEDGHGSRMVSYEEHLNLDSPLKIQVKFNDSEGNSSMLAPKKSYPPLFNTHSSPPERIAVAKQRPTTASSQEPGVLSRLTTTIWSALIRPSGPTMIEPTSEPTLSPSLRTQIRDRYGVLSDQHPWSMAHMRTLHRLLNSSIANKDDNLVPKSGPLPAPLKALVGKKLQCLTDFHWTFTPQHAYVVDAFMQTLVPAHVVEAMKSGEVEMLGDDFAQQYRGFWGGRHGEDLVWDDETIALTPVLRDAKGAIERSFVVRAVGNAVWANIETAEKEAKERGKRVRVEKERRAWEKRNGVADDEEGEESTEGSSMVESMPSVERGRRRGR